MFKNFLKWLAARLSERSTWLGITGLATAAGLNANPDQVNAVVTVGVAVAGAVLTFTKDKTPPVQ
jgi:hypothetical protein